MSTETNPENQAQTPATAPHLINHRIEFVKGAFDMNTGKLVAVQSRKYGDVELCFDAGWNIPFASIKLYSKNLAVDADAVFDDAVRLGEEICRRWNECPPKA